MQMLNLDYAQYGLAYDHDHAIYVTLTRKDKQVIDFYHEVQALANDLNQYCQQHKGNVVAIMGVSFTLWQAFAEVGLVSNPKGLTNTDTLANTPSFSASGGDLWLQLKGKTKQSVSKLLAYIAELCPAISYDIETVNAARRPKGKVLGQRFTDGIINPVDAINLSERILIGQEEQAHQGGAFAITQKFQHDWQQMSEMSEQQLQQTIGRSNDDVILEMHDEDSHIKRARTLMAKNENLRILRQSLPYGDAGAGREEGVYFVGYAKSTDIFDQVIKHMQGGKPGHMQDRLMNLTKSQAGNYWYIPSAKELSLATTTEQADTVGINAYFTERSKNGYMFYNSKDYLYAMARGDYAEGDAPSQRVLHLLDRTFSRWHNRWYDELYDTKMGHLFDHLDKGEAKFKSASVMLRKGLALKKTLANIVVDPDYSKKADTFRIDPKELIVGVMPNLSLGMGKEVLEYLTDQEREEAFLHNLSEYSAMGHIVPDHSVILDKGLQGYIDELAAKQKQAAGEKKEFYQAMMLSLEGVQAHMQRYADLAKKMYEALPKTVVADRENLLAIEKRMRFLSQNKPASFHDAVQMIFTMHSALHLTGEPVSIGRLDQLLSPFYEQDKISEEEAQEIIDCLWLKLDEKVLLNRHHFQDRMTYGTTAVNFSAGNFPQGGAINQWIQQITVGGYIANDDPTPTDGCNPVTMLCLKATRRLPLNAPCLSLRVNKDTPKVMLEEASKAILSGGAMPILLNDDKLCVALKNSGKQVTTASARNYACDGCYEAMFAGQNEFTFSNLGALDPLELTLNEGSMYAEAGPVHILGMKTSFPSKSPKDIKDFDEFLSIYLTHFRWLANKFYFDILSNYGSVSKVCPTPLLSSIVEGCVEQGRDLYDGGARYHIIAPMIIGLSNAIDSIYAIKKLVFDKETAITDLDELRKCLICDWGQQMKEPFINELTGPEAIQEEAARYQQLRQATLALPKYGQGQSDELTALADRLVGELCHIAVDSLRNPTDALAGVLENIHKNYGSKAYPFELQVTPGVGTFEGYVGEGLQYGASADGRRSSMPLASDFSPTPAPQDMPVDHKPRKASKGLKDWDLESISYQLANAAPTDINIRENFSLTGLQALLQDYAESKIGSTLLTITTADPDTFQNAAKVPEKYDLVRARMGGWSEFYVAMFPEHQAQHQRRPIFEE